MDRKALLKLYPEYTSVLGPYLRKDGRKHVVLNSRDLPRSSNNKTKTISYPKALKQIEQGRLLNIDETVDHIDENKTNDTLLNFQILSKSDNIKKSHALGNSTAEHLVEHTRSPVGKCLSSMRIQGENNMNSKFTTDEVEELRQQFSEGLVSKKAICDHYNVTRRAVENMLNGTSYQDCDGPLAKKQQRR